jgi:hypothetical protein
VLNCFCNSMITCIAESWTGPAINCWSRSSQICQAPSNTMICTGSFFQKSLHYPAAHKQVSFNASWLGIEAIRWMTGEWPRVNDVESKGGRGGRASGRRRRGGRERKMGLPPGGWAAGAGRVSFNLKRRWIGLRVVVFGSDNRICQVRGYHNLFKSKHGIRLRSADVGRVRTLLLIHSTHRASHTHKMDDSKMLYSLTAPI